MKKNCKGCEFFVATIEFTGRGGKKIWKTWQEGMDKPSNGCRCMKFNYNGDRIPRNLIDKENICDEFSEKE